MNVLDKKEHDALVMNQYDSGGGKRLLLVFKMPYNLPGYRYNNLPRYVLSNFRNLMGSGALNKYESHERRLIKYFLPYFVRGAIYLIIFLFIK